MSARSSLDTPAIGELGAVVETLASWQSENVAFQLHPGDVGLHWARGAGATAGALRRWRRHGRIVALGLRDGPDLIRLTTAPDMRRDSELAEQIAADLADADRGVLPPGAAAVEAPDDAVLHGVLQAAGWVWDESWVPLRHDFDGLADGGDLQVEIVDRDAAAVWSETCRGAFERSRFGEQQCGRWPPGARSAGAGRCWAATAKLRSPSSPSGRPVRDAQG